MLVQRLPRAFRTDSLVWLIFVGDPAVNLIVNTFKLDSTLVHHVLMIVDLRLEILYVLKTFAVSFNLGAAPLLRR